MGARIWALKAVYQSSKWPGYVTGYPNKLWQIVTVSRLARNCTGKYKNWFNASDSNDSRSMDWLDVDQWKVISTNTETTEHDSSDHLISKVNVNTKPNVINYNHDNTEQYETDSYFDTSKELRNMYFSFINNDKNFETKKDELSTERKS